MFLEIGCGSFTLGARCREQETIVVILQAREEKAFLGSCGHFVQHALVGKVDFA